ncbi:MAG: hypothetical protein ACOYL6_14615 [Bacteriovoracaceae bacterium]
MNHLIKIVEFFMNFAAGKSHEFSEQVVEIARKLVMLVVTSLGSMAVLCVGITLTIIDLTKQLDSVQGFTGSWTFTVGLILSGVSMVIFLLSLSQEKWMKAAGFREKKEESNSKALEEAVALLIVSFVEERKSNRGYDKP